MDLTDQERQLIIEALDKQVQDFVQEMQISKDVASIYWRHGIKDTIALHDSARIKYLVNEIERNVTLIKRVKGIPL